MEARIDQRLEARGDGGRGLPRWWNQRAGKLPVWAWAAVTLAVVSFVLGFGAWWTYGRGGHFPSVKGFYDGRTVTFVHTETSDPKVAQRLSGMVSSPVLVVPALADVPASALGNVYVFASGVKGPGPLGFQPDVFDSAPSSPGYSPLRELNLVSWEDGTRARELDSAAEVQAAAEQGKVSIERTGVVVNMPFVTWPGGSR